MNEEPMPGTSPAEQDVDRRWRQRSLEEPSSSTDARIRAAARDAIAPSAPFHGRTPRRARWTRVVPLAAAASVALLAVGLVRLMPREEYQAIPRPDVYRPREALDAPAATPHESEPDVEPSPGEGVYVVPETRPAAQPEPAPERDDTAGRMRAPERVPGSGATRTQRSEAVAAENLRVAPSGQAAVSDQASVERTAKAREEPAPATAPGPAGITTTAAPAASRHVDPGKVLAIPATLATQVQNDAAQRTGLDRESIRIVGVDPIAWLDASLGCEAPRGSAPEARVPGYVVTVDASGTILRYHTDGRDRIVICEEE